MHPGCSIGTDHRHHHHHRLPHKRRFNITEIRFSKISDVQVWVSLISAPHPSPGLRVSRRHSLLLSHTDPLAADTGGSWNYPPLLSQ